MQRQLQSVDRLFLDLDSDTTTMAVTPLYFYDPSGMPGGTFSYSQLLAHIDRCVRSIPVLFGRLDRVAMDLDNPFLVEDPHFDIENHVRHTVLENPSDVKQLSKAITKFHGQPIDTKRPLWEALVISGVNIKSLPKNCFVLALKIHHAVADGMTVMDMTAKLHGLAPIGEPVQLESSRSTGFGGLLDSATRVLTGNLKQSMKLVKPLLQVAPQLSLKALSYSFERLGKSAVSAPTTRFNADVSTERVWGYAVLPMSEFKKIRKLIPTVTFNDLVLTVVAGGLREYLADKNELPGESLRVAAPISVRAEVERSSGGNEVGMLAIDLPVHIEDPMEQLKLISKSADRAKAEHANLGGRTLSDVVKFLPPAYMTYLTNALGNFSAKAMIHKLGDTVVTNVPGPNQEISLLGARLVNMSGAGPISHGLGLIHPVVTYNGNVNIAAMSCPEMIPDMKFYTQCLYNSFARLQQSIQARYEGVLNAPVSESAKLQVQSDALKEDSKPESTAKPVKPARKRAPVAKASGGRAKVGATKKAVASTAKKTAASTVKKPAANTAKKPVASTAKKAVTSTDKTPSGKAPTENKDSVSMVVPAVDKATVADKSV